MEERLPLKVAAREFVCNPEGLMLLLEEWEEDTETEARGDTDVL